MNFLKVKSLDEALILLHEHFEKSFTETEIIALEDSLDRIIAEDIYSLEDVPGFDRSTVDGYAVMSKNTFGASESVPSLLDIVFDIAMGEQVNKEIKDGQGVYIPTGGMLPKFADSVVMVEYTEQFDEHTVAIYKPVSPGFGVIHKGDELKTGDLIMSQGKKITEMDIGILAAAGINKFKAYAPLKACVISTGDEIINVDEPISVGKIRDVNGYVISSLLKKQGCSVTSRKIINDDFDKIKQAIEKGLDSSDFVIISGGSSVGIKDYTYDAINSISGGNVILHGLSVKPGKPTIIGDVDGKAVFGLPGHPVSAVIVFKLIIDYYINLLTGKSKDTIVKAILTDNVHSSPGKLTCQAVKLTQTTENILAEPIYGKSGLLNMLAKSDGFIKIPEFSEGLNKGTTVDVVLL